MQTRFGDSGERYRYARPTDIEAFTTTLHDPEVGRWLWFMPTSEDALRRFFGPMIDMQWQALAHGEPPTSALFVVERDEDEFLGQGAVTAVEGSAGGFEIGFALRREAWGAGVGTRFAEFLITWAVRQHGAYRIQGACLEGNETSAAILRRLGLVLEGTRAGFRLKGDTRHTERQFGAPVADLDDGLLHRTADRIAFDDE